MPPVDLAPGRELDDVLLNLSALTPIVEDLLMLASLWGVYMLQNKAEDCSTLLDWGVEHNVGWIASSKDFDHDGGMRRRERCWNCSVKMKYSTRNAFYLRASNYRVIPLFLYLDERHVDWMEDNVLEAVMGELQPKMRDLLFDGRYQKKHKVYVERGEGYQYCYFLRTTTRTEVVLLKQKTFGLRPPTPPRKVEPSPSPRKQTPRSRRDRSTAVSSEPGDSPPLAIAPESPEDVKPVINDEEEERNIKDWKPDVSLTYKGFGTSSVQLVLIIEPYPPLPSSEYAPPSSRLSTRSASVMSSRSRSRTGTRATYARNSSMSLSLAPSSSTPTQPQMRNMRNASRSVSATPGPSYGRGSSTTPAGTPGPGGAGGGGGGNRDRTPLFMPRDTPFGEDEDDEEEHLAYTAALREGRMRLPSVSRPAGPELAEVGKKRKGSRRSVGYQEDDEDDDDVPEGIMEIGHRLVRSSEIEEGVVRVQGGWEERGEGEESAVMGREEPGD